VIRSSKDLFNPGATAARSMQDDEIAHSGVARALFVHDDWCAALEEGIADEKLPAAGKLGDEDLQSARR